MCLERITKKFKPNSRDPEREGIGWKHFQRLNPWNNSGIEWQGSFKTLKRTLTQKDVGKWLNEKRFRGDTSDFLTVGVYFQYRIGWHFYLSKKEAYEAKAHAEVVKKIRFKRATAFGTQCGSKIGVAKEIMLVGK